MIYKLSVICFYIVSSMMLPLAWGDSSQVPKKVSAKSSNLLTLVHATMCEGLKELEPINKAIVFSINIEKISCFTSFDPVPNEAFIYHKWFHRNKISTRIKLALHPPRWSTVSSIQFREEDKGPWRVEIWNEAGTLIKVLRFSIVD